MYGISSSCFSQIVTMKKKVAIIGAGIAGLSLALFLNMQGFDVTIYELRSADVVHDGAVTLSPNGLRSLDALGPDIVDRICSKGYKFRCLTFRSHDHEYLDAIEVGNSDKYGFDCFRIYRHVILDELKALVKAVHVPIFYERKFSRIVLEIGDDVIFEFADGSQENANLLIGADGIHSRVRKHLLPDIEPAWTNGVVVWGIAPTSAVEFPTSEYRQTLPASVHGPTGAVHLAPQQADGSELVVAVQWRTHERTRSEFEELRDDKAALRKIVEDFGSINEVTRSAIASAPDHTFSFWPFYSIPMLDTWYSHTGNVIIVGDAAHAIPPTGG